MVLNRSYHIHLQSNYCKFDKQILDTDLDTITQYVYIVLCDQKESFHPSVQALANKTRLSKRTIQRALKKLVERNMLELVEPGTGKKATVYRFTPRSEWTLWE